MAERDLTYPVAVRDDLTFVSWNPTITDGSQNVTEELQTAIQAAAGKTFYIPDGTYYINDLFGDITLAADLPDVRVLCGKKAIFKYDYGHRAIMYPGEIAAGSNVDVSACDLAIAPNTDTDYVTRVTVASLPTGIEKGARCHVHVEEKWIDTLAGRIGEAPKITAWEAKSGGGYYIYFDRQLAYHASYAASSTMNIRLYGTKVFEWEGGLFTANGQWDDAVTYNDGTDRYSAIRIHAVNEGRVERVTCEKTWGQCVQWIGCPGFISRNNRYRRLPNLLSPEAGATTFNITAISKANPGVITVTGHGLTSSTDEQAYWLSGIGGMTELNGRWVRLVYVNANQLSLQDYNRNAIDTSGYTTYTSGGTAVLGGVVALGYGDMPYGACTDGLCKNNTSSEGRHGNFSSGGERGTTSYNVANWYLYGMPTDYVVDSCESFGAYGIPFDFHEHGRRVHVKNCHAYHNLRGPESGTYVGCGFQIRCMDVTIENCSVQGGTWGIRFSDVNHPVRPVHVLRNFAVRDLYSDDDSDTGIYSDAEDSVLPAYIQVDGFTAHNVGKAISAGEKTVFRCTGLKASAFDIFADVYGGATIEIYDKPSLDFRDGRSGANYAFYMRSDATNGGSTAILYDGVALTKGSSSNKPTAIFTEGDTTANKTVFCKEINERNPSGTTETLMVTAGATTMRWATDIKSKFSGNAQQAVTTSGTAKTITGATQANPVVVTSTAHGFSSNQYVYHSSVGGMTQLNGNTYKITVIDANSYSLQTIDGTNVDGSGFGAYTSGGSAQRATVLFGYDYGKTINVNASTTPVICVRKNAFPGATVDLYQKGAGQVQVVAESGATLNSRFGYTRLAGQYARARLECDANSDFQTAAWNISGDLAGSSDPEEVVIPIAVSDEVSNLTTGTAKVTFRMPFAMTLTAVRANVNTAPTGSTLVVDINEEGTTILSTKLSIDVSEETSTTAATPAVISDTALADDAEITIDIDQVGSTIPGKGLKVYLIGRRT